MHFNYQSIWKRLSLMMITLRNIIKSDQEDKTNENLEILKSDETYGFDNITRNQELSTIQLTCLKSKIESSNLPTKKLSKEYNVYISLINNIKRTNLYQLWKGGWRKLAKFYETEMKNIIQELMKFINWVDHVLAQLKLKIMLISNWIKIISHISLENCWKVS